MRSGTRYSSSDFVDSQCHLDKTRAKASKEATGLVGHTGAQTTGVKFHCHGIGAVRATTTEHGIPEGDQHDRHKTWWAGSFQMCHKSQGPKLIINMRNRFDIGWRMSRNAAEPDTCAGVDPGYYLHRYMAERLRSLSSCSGACVELPLSTIRWPQRAHSLDRGVSNMSPNCAGVLRLPLYVRTATLLHTLHTKSQSDIVLRAGGVANRPRSCSGHDTRSRRLYHGRTCSTLMQEMIYGMSLRFCIPQPVSGCFLRSRLCGVVSITKLVKQRRESMATVVTSRHGSIIFDGEAPLYSTAPGKTLPERLRNRTRSAQPYLLSTRITAGLPIDPLPLRQRVGAMQRLHTVRRHDGTFPAGG
nr:hypothetical protein CFP56_36377 [Quercus suber]